MATCQLDARRNSPLRHPTQHMRKLGNLTKRNYSQTIHLCVHRLSINKWVTECQGRSASRPSSFCFGLDDQSNPSDNCGCSSVLLLSAWAFASASYDEQLIVSKRTSRRQMAVSCKMRIGERRLQFPNTAICGPTEQIIAESIVTHLA